ncbi:hypothetical protein Pint_28224 [Pistacia integerrima]|uniref:Uncharacterized protein n=1 Tax=Pistacia integerrima TaxID=434235 RepID=A0ACC0YV62_9ROSI|nr:hypothetical protein Pint_28224 [Pistacia integerrima]
MTSDQRSVPYFHFLQLQWQAKLGQNLYFFVFFTDFAEENSVTLGLFFNLRQSSIPRFEFFFKQCQHLPLHFNAWKLIIRCLLETVNRQWKRNRSPTPRWWKSGIPTELGHRSMGGPLAEALRSSTSNSSPTSVLHQLPRSSTFEASFVST